jgi:hypothetical protein
MLTYYCCGCRAQYLAQPKRCPRCKGRSFSGVNDDAPTAALVNEPAGFAVVAPENLDAELAEAFAASERFRQGALSGRPALPAAAVVLEGDDAPATPRDMPAPPYDPALSVNRPGER